mgnify:CR=1 FL=1|jgi:hypothetical protein
MASLAGSQIKDSYVSLLKLDGNTDSTAAGNGSNAVQIKTGDNDATPLYLNTDRLGIGGQPSAKLQVEESTHGADVQINMRSLNDSGTGRTTAIKFDPDARKMHFGEDFTNLVLDTSNVRVGIGNDSPESLLHVQGDTTAQVQLHNTSSGNAPKLLFDGLVGANPDYVLGSIRASWDTHTNIVSEIRFESGTDTTNKDDGVITFWTSSASSSVAERMRISPTGSTTIYGNQFIEGTDAFLQFHDTGETANAGAGIFTIKSDNDQLDFMGRADDASGNVNGISLLRTGVARFHQNVGIGGANSVASLDIIRTNDSAPHLSLQQSESSGTTYNILSDDAGSFSIREGADTRFIIDTNGRISINDSSSTKRLNVFDTDNAAGRFTRSTASATTGHLSDAFVVRGKTGGDMADGFGTMIAFEINDSANSDNSIGGCGMMRDGADNSGKFFIANNNAGTYSTNFYVDKTGNVSIGTDSVINSTIGSTSAKFLDVDGGSYMGIITLARTTTGNNNNLGSLQFVNKDNADSANNDADGELVSYITSTVATSDSNGGDDSGANLLFYTKPESGTIAKRFVIGSDGNITHYGSGATTFTIEAPTGGNDSAALYIEGGPTGSGGDAKILLKSQNGTENKNWWEFRADAGDDVYYIKNGNNDLWAFEHYETGGHFFPVTDSTHDIGKSDKKVKDVHADYVLSQGNQNHVANTMSSPYYRFDGENDQIDIADNVNLDLSDALSIECLFKTEAIDTYQELVNKADAAQAYSTPYRLNITNAGLLHGVIANGSSSNTAVTSSQLTAGQWYHAVFTADGSNLKLYLNGTLVDTESQSITPETQNGILTIGRWGDSGAEYYPLLGEMQKVRLYNKALTATEVKEMYSGASVPFKYKFGGEKIISSGDRVPSGSVGNWVFNGTSGGDRAWDSTLSAIKVTSGGSGTVTARGHLATSNLTTFKEGQIFEITAEVYIPSSNGTWTSLAVRQSDMGGGSTTVNDTVANVSTKDSWQSLKSTVTLGTDVTGSIEIDGDTTSGSGQIFYFRNISVQIKGCVAEYDGSGIASDKWFDKSGNDLHGTVSGATVENAPANDDGLVYEEGTWTPAFNASGSATVTENHYVRIGNWVRCQAKLDNIQSGGSSTAVIITGLPYAPKDNTSSGTVMHNEIDTQSTNNGIVPYINTSSEVYLYENIDDGAWLDLKWSQIVNNDDARITFDYMV